MAAASLRSHAINAARAMVVWQAAVTRDAGESLRAIARADVGTGAVAAAGGGSKAVVARGPIVVCVAREAVAPREALVTQAGAILGAAPTVVAQRVLVAELARRVVIEPLSADVTPRQIIVEHAAVARPIGRQREH